MPPWGPGLCPCSSGFAGGALASVVFSPDGWSLLQPTITTVAAAMASPPNRTALRSMNLSSPGPRLTGATARRCRRGECVEPERPCRHGKPVADEDGKTTQSSRTPIRFAARLRWHRLVIVVTLPGLLVRELDPESLGPDLDVVDDHLDLLSVQFVWQLAHELRRLPGGVRRPGGGGELHLDRVRRAGGGHEAAEVLDLDLLRPRLGLAEHVEADAPVLLEHDFRVVAVFTERDDGPAMSPGLVR